ncbi:phage tail tape measure protein [Delftia sp. SD018]|uniref:phage tail tape measure protein n=1 Tax=unclassified Delftia TaxID=2613839 RepID=UPI001A975F3D|nr:MULTISPECIES: phage tail tape measure protein [unclassified Delftia]MBO0990971.1 phage tail tape measure protein [Delftia sp. SD083]MBO1035945.1 phage tail tape measure protein [Delftia sp. SD018]
MQERIWALEDEQAATGKAYDMFRRVYQRERDVLSEQAAAVQESISAISASVSMLNSAAADLWGSVDSTQQLLAARGMAYVEQALAGMRSGASASDYAGLQNAISAARNGISSGVYATEFDRQRDILVLAGQLSEMGDIAGQQLTFEERQLKALQAQIDGLDRLATIADELVNGSETLVGTVDEHFNKLMAFLNPTKPDQPAAGGAGGGGGGGAQLGGGGPSTVGTPVFDPNAGTLTYPDGSVAHLTPDEVYWHTLIRGDNWNGPAFASGAAFSNSVVTRPTLFDMGLMGERGAEGILPLANVGGRLGVYAATGGDRSGVAELRDVLERLDARMAQIAANTNPLPGYVDQRDQVSEGGAADRVEVMNVEELSGAIANALRKGGVTA